MNAWLALSIAIAAEVIGTSALKASEGFTRFWPSVVVVIGYAVAFYGLSLVLKTIPVGIAYAVWSGLGIVLITLAAYVLYGQRIDTAVVETPAVDDGLVFRQPEQARLRVARLRTRRDGADLDEAETERAECVEVLAVLVQPGRKPDRVGKLDAERAHRQFRGRRRCDETHQAAALGHAQRVQRQAMRGFGFQ